MPINQSQLFAQIESASSQYPQRRKSHADRVAHAQASFLDLTLSVEELRWRATRVSSQLDRMYRCASPLTEPFNACISVQDNSASYTMFAVDGSGFLDDLSSENWGVINIASAAWVIQPGLPYPPTILTDTTLHLGDGEMLSYSLDLQRDKLERVALADISVRTWENFGIGLIDGPLELWSSKTQTKPGEFPTALASVRAAYQHMTERGVFYAGYVDSAKSNLIIHLLELATIPEANLLRVRQNQHFRGVKDREILMAWLKPGFRTAVFEILGRSQALLDGELKICFCYLNCGSIESPAIARIEIPMWVVVQADKVNQLCAAILTQTAIVPNVPTPYILARVDEMSRITDADRQIIRSLLRQKLNFEVTLLPKNAAKTLTGAKLW